MTKIKSILAFAALMLCGGAWAATPLVEWCGDFNITTKTDSSSRTYTINLNDNATIAQDGSAIVMNSVATRGILINLSSTFVPATTPLTVMVRYENRTENQDSYMVGFNNATSHKAGGMIASGGIMRAVNTNYGFYSASGRMAPESGSGKMFVTYASSGLASKVYRGYGWDGKTQANATDGCSAQAGVEIDSIAVGGPIGGSISPAKGAKITGIAVFSENSFDPNTYIFPDEIKYYNGDGSSGEHKEAAGDVFKFMIPATATLPVGTKVMVDNVAIGLGSRSYTGNVPKYMKIGEYISNQVNNTGSAVTGDQMANKSFKEGYVFSGKNLVLDVGTEYDVLFTADGTATFETTKWWAITPQSGTTSALKYSIDGFSKQPTQEVFFHPVSAPEGYVIVGNQVLPAEATYNGKNYLTLVEAMEIASVEHYGEITVLIATAATLDGYRVKGGKVVAIADYYAHWTNAANCAGIVDLTTLDNSNNGQFHQQTIKPYDPSTDIEGEAWTGSWYTRLGRGSGWTAPGYALRFTSALTGSHKKLNASYTPFAVSGLIVEPGAAGFGFECFSSDTDRYTDFGNTDATTYSLIAEDFTILRARGNVRFYGEHILEIASGKTLHLNDQTVGNNNYAAIEYKAVVASGASLKLVGEGTLSVGTLDASGATLDLSKATSTIAGNLIVDDTTKLVLPSSVGEGEEFVLCTDTLTAPAFPIASTMIINGEETNVRLTYNTTNKSVSYAVDTTVYWTPDTTKLLDGGILDWTSTEKVWLAADGVTTKSWSEATDSTCVRIDASQVAGIKIDGKVTVPEVVVFGRVASPNSFEFHNHTLDVIKDPTTGKDPTTDAETDCLTATVVNLSEYTGNLGLKVPIVGQINFGNGTHLIFKTGAAGGDASKAYSYNIVGRAGAIEVAGSGKFQVPTSMYNIPFAPNADATIVYDDVDTAITGTLSGTGTVELKNGKTLNLNPQKGQTLHYVSSGTTANTLCWASDNGNAVSSNDSKEKPFVTVESGATLNIYGHDYAGWSGSIGDHSWFVNNGTIVFQRDGNNSRFWRDHIVLGNGSKVKIDTSSRHIALYGGAGTADKCQIMLESGTATIEAGVTNQGQTRQSLYFGNDGSGTYGTKGAGISVGEGATLTVSVPVAGADALTKWGAGALVLSDVSSYTGTITLSGGSITVPSTFDSSKVSGAAAKIVGATTTTYYKLLADAIAAAIATDEIEILANSSETLALTKDVTFTVASGSDYTLSGTVTTAQHLTKKGAGTLQMTSGSNDFTGVLTVSAGTLVCNTKDRGLAGTQYVESGATLKSTRASDSLHYDATTETHVKGTLELANARWSLRAANKIYLYPGSSIVGAKTDGTLDNIANNQTSLFVVKNGDVDGEVTIDTEIRFRGTGVNPVIDIAEGMTVNYINNVGFRGNASNLKLTGAGTFKIAATASLNNLTTLYVGSGVTLVDTGTITSGLDFASGAILDITGGIPTLASGKSIAVSGLLKVKGGALNSCFLNTSADPSVSGDVEILDATGAVTGVGAIAYDSAKGGLIISESTTALLIGSGDAQDKDISTIPNTITSIIVDGAHRLTGSGELAIGSIDCLSGSTLTIGAGVTLKFTDGTIQIPDGLVLEAGAKISGTAVPNFAGKTFKVDGASMTPGAYTLADWTAFMAQGNFGYGAPTLEIVGDCSYTYQFIPMVGKIALKVFSAEEVAAKPLRIWPVGDSITEGYNNSGNCANYRVQLAAKLTLAGHKVQMVGQNTHRSFMPSGEAAPDEWAWHSGVSAQRVWTGGSGNNMRAGYMEAIDAAMFQVGEADIVLVKLATNDIGNNDSADHILSGVQEICRRIAEGMPKAKIVLGTTVWYNDRDVTTLNNKVKAWVATNPHNGRVILADLNAALPAKEDDQGRVVFHTDNVHPNWNGHDKMSDAWLAGVNKAIEAGIEASPTKPAVQLGAENNIPEEYRRYYTRQRKLEIQNSVSYAKDAGESIWTETSGQTQSKIRKVAYYMELVRPATDFRQEEIRYIWVDMDAPGQNFSDVTFPLSANKQQIVNKLHVYSNMGSVHNVAANDDTVQGFLEFSPFNATPGNCSNVSGAPANNWNIMDWNDTLGTSGDGRGVMQIHRIKKTGDELWTNAEVLFAYNNWGSGNDLALKDAAQNQTVGELGIGNYAQHWLTSDETAGTSHPGIGKAINNALGTSIGLNNNWLSIDYSTTRFSPWADTMNAKAYSVKNLEIWTIDDDTLPTTIVDGQTYGTLAEAIEAAGTDKTIEVVLDPADESIELTHDIKIAVDEAFAPTIAANFTGAHKLTKVGKGTIKLTGSNAFNAYDIQGGAVEMTSASAIAAGATLTGSGRVIFNQVVPTASNNAKVPRFTIQNTWTGTIELKNVGTTEILDGADIILFGKWANANSTLALNGVTSTMYTGTNYTDDNFVFGTLEIMEDGWTSTTGGYSVSPLYKCNLSGSGKITINQTGGGSNAVNFVGDHSGFTGSIVLGDGTTKGLVFSPAGSDRLWTGIAAKKVIVQSGAVVGASGIWTASAGIVVNGTILTANGFAPDANTALTGSGRVVFNEWLPATNAKIVTEIKKAEFTGMTEIRNYQHTADAHSIINLQAYASTAGIALNGVTMATYTAASGSYLDQTLGCLEIMEGGWQTTTGAYNNNYPLYTAALRGSGTITIRQAGTGTINFVGDHSEFSGAIAMSATGKGVVLNKAGSARVTATDRAMTVTTNLEGYELVCNEIGSVKEYRLMQTGGDLPEIVVPEGTTEVSMLPGQDVTVPESVTVEKIKVVYNGVDLAKAEDARPKYINVTISDEGKVALETTEAAKPEAVKIKMTLPKEGEGEGAKDKVSFTITDPIPGLFYSIVSANDPAEFDKQSGVVEDSDGTQATGGESTTTSIDMPDAKVKYFRVRVKATK